MPQPLSNGLDLVDKLELMGLTRTAIGKELGLGPSTISNWCNKKDIPRYAILALETLVRDKGGRVHRPKTKTAVIRVPAAQLDFISHFIRKLGGIVKELEEI